MKPVAYEITTINHSFKNPKAHEAHWLAYDIEAFKREHARCLEIVDVKPLTHASDDMTPNVEVQRDSGSIIAGGSAGTTSSTSTEEV